MKASAAFADRSCASVTFGPMGIPSARVMMLLSGAAMALFACDAWAAPGVADSRVRCESQEGRWNQCALPPGEGDTMMLRQLSRNACIRNNSWGTNEGGLWVSRGCRAEFGREKPPARASASADREAGTRSRLLRCESRNGGHRQCPIETVGGVRLSHKLSDGDCELGKSWGYDENGIWVARGCRAEFEVTTPDRPSVRFFQRLLGRGSSDAGGQGQPLRCESVDGKRQECRLPPGTGRVELVHQLSKAGCEDGKSWGWNAQQVWVAEGCRAEFMTWPSPPAE